MADPTREMTPYHVKLESVDWLEVLPVLRMFGLFRVAMQPTKLGLAWLLVVTLYGLGMALAWLLDPAGVGMTGEEVHGTALLWQWVQMQTAGLWSVIDAVVALDLGIEGDGLLARLHVLLVENPTQMWQEAPGYLVVLGAVKFVVVTLLGLGIARLAVLQLSRERTGGPSEAVGFIARKGMWALAAPMIPLVVVLGMGLLLAAVGLVLFNVPVLDLLGGLLFGPMLLVGVGMALVLLALGLAVHLLTAAVAAEGTDAYDAVSRCFAYVTARPWQVIGYVVAGLVYGAVTFLLVWAVVGFGAWVSGEALSMWVWGPTWAGGAGASEYGGTTSLSAWLIGLWKRALLAIPAAYAVSFYFCAAVQTYLLVRHSADGSDLSDCFDPQADDPNAPATVAGAADEAAKEAAMSKAGVTKKGVAASAAVEETSAGEPDREQGGSDAG